MEKININQLLQEYAEQTIDKLEINLKNTVDRDVKIIWELNSLKNIRQDLRLKNLMKRFVDVYDSIRSHSNKPEVMNTIVRGGEEENHLILDINFKYKNFMMNPISYPYLLRPNNFSLTSNFTWFNNRFGGDNETKSNHLIKECIFGGGFEYNYSKSKQAIFAHNTLFLDGDLEVETVLKKYHSHLDVKRKQSTSVFKVNLHKNFEERPFIFRDKAEFDERDRMTFEIGNKTINNKTDKNNCSTELCFQTPDQDSRFYAKAIYEKSKCDFKRLNVFNFKVSSGIYKSLNSFYIRNKLFVRKLFDVSDLVLYQFNCEVGNIVNLNRNSRELKIHELFLNNNFKGVVNPSPKIVVEEGKTGDALGYKNYIMFSNKFILKNLPVFNSFLLTRDGFQISPFFHLNLMVLPDNKQSVMGTRKNNNTNATQEMRDDQFDPSANTQQQAQTQNSQAHQGLVKDNPLYLSAGFGINLTSEAFACEVYYNAYVKKNSNDIGTEFSFNFGLD